MAKETYYFPHDYYARSDTKMEEMLDDYGSVGYGEYWMIAEILHEEEESRIELTERFYRVRAKMARMAIDTYKVFIDDCCTKYELMKQQEGYLTIARVDRNKDKRVSVKIGRSEAGKAGAAKRWGKNSNSHENDEEKMAIANGKMANDSKGKEIREKENNTSSKEEDINISADLIEKYKKEHWISWPSNKIIIKKKIEFTDLLKPYLEKYGADICNSFWKYWTEPNKSKSGQIRWEAEKFFDFPARLGTFKKNQNNNQ